MGFPERFVIVPVVNKLFTLAFQHECPSPISVLPAVRKQRVGYGYSVQCSFHAPPLLQRNVHALWSSLHLHRYCRGTFTHCGVHFTSTVIVEVACTAVFISTSTVIAEEHSCTAVFISTHSVISEVECPAFVCFDISCCAIIVLG